MSLYLISLGIILFSQTIKNTSVQPAMQDDILEWSQSPKKHMWKLHSFFRGNSAEVAAVKSCLKQM